MSTAAIAPDSPTAPATPTARRAVTGRQTFLRTLASEWLKLRSLRSTWVTSFLTVTITVLLGAGAAIGFARSGDPSLSESAGSMITLGASFGQIVVAVLAALVITGEYASGQIRSSLAAVPRRGRLLLAKSAVVAAFAFLLGILSILLTWAIAAPFMEGRAGSLTDTDYLSHFWGTGLTFTGIALLAFGIGMLARSTAGSITAIVVLLFVVQIPLSLLVNRWEWPNTVMGVLPSTVSEAASDPLNLSDSWGQAGSVNFLEHWQALLVFGAWAIVPVIAAWVVFSKRDA